MDVIKQYREKVNEMDPSDVQFEKDLLVIQQKDGKSDILYNIKRDFTIIHLEIDAVLSKLDSKEVAEALQNELVINQKMMEIIDAAHTGIKILPPMLYTVGEKLAVFEGKHQIGLCRHLNQKVMPFLVRHHAVDKVQAIIKGV